MGLEAETTKVVSQFELPDHELNRATAEFLRQMDEGLRKDGTSVSQIPTYVTGVPNGTEKVRCHPNTMTLFGILWLATLTTCNIVGSLPRC
jgi:hypothetical protein